MNREEMIQWLQGRGIEKIENLTDKQIQDIVMERMEKEAISS